MCGKTPRSPKKKEQRRYHENWGPYREKRMKFKPSMRARQGMTVNMVFSGGKKPSGRRRSSSKNQKGDGHGRGLSGREGRTGGKETKLVYFKREKMRTRRHIIICVRGAQAQVQVTNRL